MLKDSTQLDGRLTNDRRPKAGRSKPVIEPEQIDGRTRLGRRYKALIRDLTAELGDNLSPAEGALVSLTASVIIRTEQVQAGIINGSPIDDTELVRLTNTVSRLVRELNNTKAKRKAAGPSALEQWLANRETEDEADA